MNFSEIIRFLSLFLCVGAFNSRGADTQLELGTGIAPPGFAGAMSALLKDGTNISALQFDVHFDKAAFDAIVPLRSFGAADHVFLTSSPEPGVTRVVIFSPINAQITSAAFADLIVLVSAKAPQQNSSIHVENFIATDPTGTRAAATALPGTFIITATGPAALGAVVIRSDGHIRFTLSGDPTAAYRIEASTDLTTWTDLGPIRVIGQELDFVDPDAPAFAYRFYRAVLLL